MFKLLGKKIISTFTLIKFPYLDLCNTVHCKNTSYFTPSLVAAVLTLVPL